MSNFTTCYLGTALAWEADELGHLNMRFYFAKASEARTNFAIKLGLDQGFVNDAFSTIMPVGQHVKYHKEIKPGTGIKIETGLLRLGDTQCEMVHMIYALQQNKSGDVGPSYGLAATLVETIKHVSRRTGLEFSWPKRVQKKSAEFMVDMPDMAMTRNFDQGEMKDSLAQTTNNDMAPQLATSKKLGVPLVGQGVFQPQECDVFGRVKPTAIIGRVSEGASHLWPVFSDLGDTDQGEISTALLEAHLVHYHRPEAGDSFEVRSALRKVNVYTKEICHQVFDPISGKCYASFLATGCLFNLSTRRLVKMDLAGVEMLNEYTIAELRP